jgi:uncharacterized membrane protein (DUF485 family)
VEEKETNASQLQPETKPYIITASIILLTIYLAALVLYRFAGQWFDYQSAMELSEHLCIGLRGGFVFYCIGLLFLEFKGCKVNKKL